MYPLQLGMSNSTGSDLRAAARRTTSLGDGHKDRDDMLQEEHAEPSRA